MVLELDPRLGMSPRARNNVPVYARTGTSPYRPNKGVLPGVGIGLPISFEDSQA